MRGLTQMAHALRQVARRHEEDVDVVHGQDIRQVVDGDDVLDEDDDEGLVVGLGQVVVHAVSLTAGVRAAGADGAKLRRVDHRPRLGGGVYMGDYDPLRPYVEGPVYDPGDIQIDAHDRGHAPDVACAGDVWDIGEVDGAVLALDPDAVEAQRAQKIHNVRGRVPGYHRHDFAALQHVLYLVLPKLSQYGSPWGGWILKCSAII